MSTICATNAQISSSSSSSSEAAGATMIDRLVWFNQGKNPPDPIDIVHPTTGTCSGRNDDFWIPAIYYESHTEAASCIPRLHALPIISMHKKIITMNFLQEQIPRFDTTTGTYNTIKVPLLQLITTNCNNDDSNSNTTATNIPQFHPFDYTESMTSIMDCIKFDFFQHVIYMNHYHINNNALSTSSNRKKLLYEPQHLQAVYTLLQQSQSQEMNDIDTTIATITTNVCTVSPLPEPKIRSKPNRISIDNNLEIIAPSTNVPTGPAAKSSDTTTIDPDTMTVPEVVATDFDEQENQYDQEDNEEAHLKVQIGEFDTLSMIKQQLLQHGGWTYRCMMGNTQNLKNTNSNVVQYYWIQPNCSVDTGRPNVDYFINDEQLQQYIQNQYPHWQGYNKQNVNDRCNKNTKNVVIDTEEENDDNDGEEDEDSQDLTVGNTLVNNDNIEVDDDSDEDMSDKENYQQRSKKRKSYDSSIATTNARNNSSRAHKSTVQQLTQIKLKAKVKTTETETIKKKVHVDTKHSKANIATPKPSKQKKTSKEHPSDSYKSSHWWKYEDIPSNQQMKPILRKIGFQYHDIKQRFIFPQSTVLFAIDEAQKPEDTDLDDMDGMHPLLCIGYDGIRKFFCCYGIPKDIRQLVDTKLSSKEKERLRRWIVFANVPVTNSNKKNNNTMATKEELRNIGSPKKMEQLITKLYTLGFSTVDGKLFVPEYKQMLDYQANHKPIHEIHYFNLDTELYTKVRSYIRRSWRLGVVTSTKQTPVMEYYHRDIKKMQSNTKYYETLLFVRLWAAASSQPIPTFTVFPYSIEDQINNMYLRPFLEMYDSYDDDDDDDDDEEESSDDDDDTDEESSTTDMSYPPSSQPDSVKNINVQEEIHERVQSSPETSVTSVESLSSEEDEYDFTDTKWYLHRSLPDFIGMIWPLLVKVGFHFKSGSYGHSDVLEPMGNTFQLQQFCVKYGVPNFTSLSDKERLVVHRWASFAHVDVKPSNSIQRLSAVRELTNTTQIQKLLIALKFQMVDNKIFIPGADYMIGGRSDRQHGVHYFIGIDEIRAYIRGAPDLNEPSTGSSRRRNVSLISADDMLALRLWAACSDQPLPIYQSQKSLLDVKTTSKHSKIVEDITSSEDETDNYSQNDTYIESNLDETTTTGKVVSYEDVDDQNWHTPSQGSEKSPTKKLFSETIVNDDSKLTLVTETVNDTFIVPTDYVVSENKEATFSQPFEAVVETKFHSTLERNEAPQNIVGPKEISFVPLNKRLRHTAFESVLESVCNHNDDDVETEVNTENDAALFDSSDHFDTGGNELFTQRDDNMEYVDSDNLQNQNQEIDLEEIDLVDKDDDDEEEEGEVVEKSNAPKRSSHLPLFTQFNPDDDDDSDDECMDSRNDSVEQGTNTSTTMSSASRNQGERDIDMYEQEDFTF